MGTLETLIYLCSCAVNNQTPDAEEVSTIDLDSLYQLAQSHMLTAMVGMALASIGMANKPIKQAVAASQRKAVIQLARKKEIFQKFEDAGIWYLPLKGAVLADWYPKFAMRESADCDVLFDKNRDEDVRDIMVSLGYQVKEFQHSIHDVYQKPPVSNFEMHKALMDDSYGQKLYDYYKDIDDKLVCGDGFERFFKPEDFYLYILSHEYKHYKSAGTGLRSLLDTYVILKHFDNLDWSYINIELQKLGLVKFEQENRNLSLGLFGSEDSLIENNEMYEYIVGSGAYGTLHNKVRNDIREHGGGLLGKAKYVTHRAFLTEEQVKRLYPMFYKYKVLIPFLPVYRLIKGYKSNKFKIEMDALREQ